MAASGFGGLAVGAPTASAASSPSADTAAFRLANGSRPIPPSFFGMSIEPGEVHTYETVQSAFVNATKLFRPEDGSPLVFRLGGMSADRAYWEPPASLKIPGGEYGIGPAWMDGLKSLLAADDGRAILDVNLAVHSTEMESAFASAAKQTLGSNLIGLEIGNEPDLYHLAPYLDKEVVPGTYSKPGWPDHYDAADYHSDYERYATALHKAAPGVPLGGPGLISSNLPWDQGMYGTAANDPGFLTLHRYPSSNCWPTTSKYYPTINLLLNPSSSTGIANTIVPTLQFAAKNHTPVRVDEVNDISCGGNTGVANTFAMALWAPDAILSFANTGVSAINWHTRPGTINTPIAVVDQTIDGKKTPVMEPQPELYGLALFGMLTEKDAEIDNITDSNPGDYQLRVWAVHEFDGMRVALLNKSSHTQTAELDFGNFNSGYLRRLTAPKVTSTNGVTFGGQTIGTDGRWHGTLQVSKVADHDGTWTVTLPPYSGGLLSLYN